MGEGKGLGNWDHYNGKCKPHPPGASRLEGFNEKNAPYCWTKIRIYGDKICSDKHQSCTFIYHLWIKSCPFCYWCFSKKHIWQHFMRLSNDLIASRASHNEAWAFEGTVRHNAALDSCTEAEFWLYLDSPPRHAWNKSATRVFSRSFVTFHQVLPECQRRALIEVEDMALTHIKTIKAKYTLSISTDQARNVHLKACQRQEQCTSVS